MGDCAIMNWIQKLVRVQLPASGPVSASPSPITQQTISLGFRSSISMAAVAEFAVVDRSRRLGDGWLGMRRERNYRCCVIVTEAETAAGRQLAREQVFESSS